ncbi:Sec7-domain-containing protein [Fomitiporia mediterranea MF3/22]|uniref:Sec7-domain-containing protein n=1 Tax=Fomitiporia mediterranea (strain MF3/22) TaxID=694068 RepID=UPI000440904F|nr:Sec7-domain-containing protein [Fomitiporia mediterranea MF3/22]EJD00904.1 Sec7-domain-containing protein [Fomitiporia mediterranea MF3/22]
MPPPPIEKSLPVVGDAERRRDSVERQPSGRPSTPLTARLFGRKSTSESVHSPTSSFGHNRNLTMSQGNTVSVVLISTALETIAASREAKRSTQLREAVDNALNMIKSGQGGDKPREIFEPLRLACETGNEKLQIASLDCISKLISYSFFLEPDAPAEHQQLASPPASPANQQFANESQATLRQPTLVDIVTHTITACHTETAPDAVSLQIVKALLSLVLSPTLLVHQSSLLKAVRTVYNIFLLSSDPVNQTVAQGGLTQMVHHVFSRCNLGNSRNGSMDGSVLQSPKADTASLKSRSSSKRPSLTPSTSETYPVPPLTPSDERYGREEEDGPSQKVEGRNSVEASVANASVIREVDNHNASEHLAEADDHVHTISTKDLFFKDAFLVFRALCKLTMKNLNTESERDLRSHAMRSKLVSLHLVLTILNSHMQVFVDPSSIIYSASTNEATSFINATKQYLCLSLSRNAVSPVPQVFEISVEIFWRLLTGMRTKLKKEIEVFFHEIFVPILEMKTATLKQKSVILGMLQRLCQEPQALVEIYLNYDCDREAADNIYEHLMNTLSKISSSHSNAPPPKASDPASPALNPSTKHQSHNIPPALSTSALAVPGNADNQNLGLSEQQLKRQGLESLVAVLRSLVTWGTATGKTLNSSDTTQDTTVPPTGGSNADGMVSDSSLDKLPAPTNGSDVSRVTTPEIPDDPGKFESAKQRKTILQDGIRRFNYKPKKGVEFLIQNGFIPSREPVEVAKFLLNTDGLSKAVIGEYLGEGDDENIATMHAFVDQLDFSGMAFVDALRTFLQTFRLPGEAQKIDRFMLKFSERYIAGNPQASFANADTAYVLSYSTIMLNTDAHNPVVKQRMTKADFIKNNRGINDGADLPEEFLSEIFDDIQTNEIRMKDEMDAQLVLPTQGPGIANALANVGRDLQKEAYVMQSLGMANKTEALFKTLMRSQRRGSKWNDQFFSASHFVHVRPMFEVAWIPFLAGISGPLTDTDDLEVVELCLEGFKCAIRIACFFDLELERNAFVTTLAKFTFLNNLGEMKAKNMEAIKALLDIAVSDGNHLRSSWHEVLSCVSQLERMQLVSNGIEIPESSRGKGRARKMPAEELANESRSTHITVAADMVFSLSHYLSGTAIVEFVRALSAVSWEEIQSSGLSEHPRLFSLQKLVEISYYNMNRIRLEWSNLWEIIGEHFNQVCCHHNPHVGFFALDALRQLAMRFLEKEELPHFKFQKDFLRPFEYTMIHNNNPDVRDMVLQCLHQMIQARVHNFVSGWRTLFSVFSAASKVLTERVVNSAFELVTRLNKEHFAEIIRHGAFADLTVCITDFCKVSKFQKISLLAIGMLRDVIPTMLSCPDCALNSQPSQDGAQSQAADDAMIKFWYPVLFSFYDIIMNGEDLEVRRLALNSLFTTLKTHGSTFSVEFWDTVCQELLFPIFAVLKSSSDLSRWSTQEDMSVWLSTTMIQALRDLIDLYTFYFETLERFLDGLLDLLCVCVCQENDTLARIGTACLQQLLENNVKKLSAGRWERVVTTFIKLFRTTTPHQLFDENLRGEVDGSNTDVSDTPPDSGQTIIPAPLTVNGDTKNGVKISAGERKRIFKQIIVKCVLQLLLIETTSELLQNNEVYDTIPPEHLLRLMGVLDHSYQFARMFNEDKELRTALWKVGFMKHLPNLLKQETSSADTLVTVLSRMYYDPRPQHLALRAQIADKFLPLGLGVITDFNKLRMESSAKNISAWMPVVARIVQGFCGLSDKAFGRFLPATYPAVSELVARDLSSEVRSHLRDYFVRVGQFQGIIERS